MSYRYSKRKDADFASVSSAMLGAVVTLVVLAGVAAVFDAPAGLNDVLLESELVQLAEAPLATIDSPAVSYVASTGNYEDYGPQVDYTYN